MWGWDKPHFQMTFNYFARELKDLPVDDEGCNFRKILINIILLLIIFALVIYGINEIKRITMIKKNDAYVVISIMAKAGNNGYY